MGVKGLNPKSDQHLISPYSNTTELFTKITRIQVYNTSKLLTLINKEVRSNYISGED